MTTQEIQTQKEAQDNMIMKQIRPWDVLDKTILRLLREVDRSKFVLKEEAGLAYYDTKLSLPYQKSKMLEPKLIAKIAMAANVRKTDAVLEIGTGSGFLTAILAKKANKVTSIEINQDNYDFAKKNLFDYKNIELIHDEAISYLKQQINRFDVIIFTVSLYELTSDIEKVLIDNLKDSGIVILPLGQQNYYQTYYILKNNNGIFSKESLFETQVEHLQELQPIKKFQF